MFFTECARLAEQYPDLATVLQQLDSQLEKMGAAGVIRPDDMASFLGVHPNRMRSALEMFAQAAVLDRVEMIECRYCEMAAPRSDYQEALDECDEYRCTDCDRPLTDRTIKIITAYRSGEKWLSDGSGDTGLPAASSLSTSNISLAEQTRHTEKDCVFHRDTLVWTLSFGGTTAHVPNMVGLNYIAELLRRPRTPIEADTLVTTIRANADTAVDTAEERIVRAGAAMPGIPLTDAKAIKAVEAELAKKKLELKDSSTDDETTRATQREISQLRNYLTQVKGHYGRPRTTGGIASRARSRVKHAIDRAITSIAKHHLPLANHLQDSIRTGNSLVYTPPEVPDRQL